MNEKIFSKKYLVKREIACGGMGTIYLATDTKLGRDVVIKILHPQYSGEPAFAKRFLREAWAMAKLDHPNIIRIWSVEEEESSHCIVMEYFPGNDLKHIIRDRGPLPVTEALSLSTQIIQGLAYAHDMGIIHRDIKPANILVNQEGKVKITDFGIAAAFSESALTMDGTVLGTPEYMAPEQARAESVGAHTDLYAVGILLYELLTGQTPYKGIPPQTLVAKLAFGSENPSLTFPRHVPGDLQNLIIKMTQTGVENRLTDINEILAVMTSDFPVSTTFRAASEEPTLCILESPPTPDEPPHIQTAVQHQSLPIQSESDNRSNLSSNLSPLKEDSGSSVQAQTSTSSQSRKLVISAIGILALVALIVWKMSQPPIDTPQPNNLPPVIEVIDQPDSRVAAALVSFENSSRSIETAQKNMSQEFESLSSAMRTLHREITDKKLPPNPLEAKQWLDRTREKVQTLMQNSQELENSQKSVLDTHMNASMASIQQAEPLFQEKLTQDQQEELRESIINLEKVRNTFKTTYSQYLQKMQKTLSTLNSQAIKTRQAIATMPTRPQVIVPPTSPPTTIEKQATKLKKEIHSLDQEVEDVVTTFEDSIVNFTTQVSKLKEGVQEIRNDDPFSPNSTQRLMSLHQEFQTLYQKAQTHYAKRQTKQEELKKTLQMARRNYQNLSGNSLESTQTIPLDKLDTMLKNNQARLNLFPPDSWRKFQDLSRQTKALFMTTEEILAQQTLTVAGIERDLTELSQKSSQLQIRIRKFHAQTVSEHRRLGTQIDTLAITVTSLESHDQESIVEEKVNILQQTFRSLQETLQQYSVTYAQQFPTFEEQQAAIQETFDNLTAAALPASLDRQTSRIRQTLALIQQDLQDLKQVNWKKVSDKLGLTRLTFTESYDRILLMRILDDFTTAYEKQDILHLQLTTSMSESRSRNLDLMFNKYSTIDVDTQIVSISTNQAEAKLIVEQLVNNKGERITPNFIIAETTISIPKKDGKWGKIQW